MSPFEGGRGMNFKLVNFKLTKWDTMNLMM